MLTYLRNHHAGLLALFIALSGTSYAVATGSIDGREIRNNSVTTRDVRNNSVLGRDLRNGRVGGADLRNGSVSGADLRDSSATGADVADGSLSGADVANAGLSGEDIRDGTVRDADIAGNAISADEIRAGSVRSEEIQNGTVRAEDLSPGAVATNATVRSASFEVPAVQNGSEDATCQSGERALGGGVSFDVPADGDRVTFSEPRAGNDAPENQGATATGWAGGLRNEEATPRKAHVWVICASS